MKPDHINAAFELLGALFTWRNALALYRDREIKGVYWPAWLFFALWGLWNLWFYPAIGQWWSMAAGALLVGGNLAWVGLAVWVRRSERAQLDAWDSVLGVKTTGSDAERRLAFDRPGESLPQITGVLRIPIEERKRDG